MKWFSLNCEHIRIMSRHRQCWTHRFSLGGTGRFWVPIVCSSWRILAPFLGFASSCGWTVLCVPGAGFLAGGTVKDSKDCLNGSSRGLGSIGSSLFRICWDGFEKSKDDLSCGFRSGWSSGLTGRWCCPPCWRRSSSGSSSSPRVGAYCRVMSCPGTPHTPRYPCRTWA